MTNRSVTHSTFSLSRTYPASPARVFSAFADPKKKAMWFTTPDGWQLLESSLDFRVGGREVSSSQSAEGMRVDYRATFQDIVEDQRIIYSYDMEFDRKRISVSVATIELTAAGAGTKLTLTEQGAYLDGFDDPKLRERGTTDLLEALGAALARDAAH